MAATRRAKPFHIERERERKRERDGRGGGESGDKNVVKWIAHQSILLLSILLFVISFFAAPWHHVVPPRHCHGRQTVFVVCRPQRAEPSAADRVIVLVLGVLVVVLVQWRSGTAGQDVHIVVNIKIWSRWYWHEPRWCWHERDSFSKPTYMSDSYFKSIWWPDR